MKEMILKYSSENGGGKRVSGTNSFLQKFHIILLEVPTKGEEIPQSDQVSL